MNGHSTAKAISEETKRQKIREKHRDLLLNWRQVHDLIDDFHKAIESDEFLGVSEDKLADSTEVAQELLIRARVEIFRAYMVLTGEEPPSMRRNKKGSVKLA